MLTHPRSSAAPASRHLRRHAAFAVLLLAAYAAGFALATDPRAMLWLFWSLLAVLLVAETLTTAWSASRNGPIMPASREALSTAAAGSWGPGVLQVLLMSPLLVLSGWEAGVPPYRSLLLVVALLGFTYGAAWVGLLASRHAPPERRARALTLDFMALLGLLALSLLQVLVDVNAGEWRATVSPGAVAATVIPVYWAVIALVGAAVLRSTARNELSGS